MFIANKPKIIIAAIACRPYVEAAIACGYEVVAMDAFADVEVSHLAESCYQLEFINGQLDMHQLMQVINGLDLYDFVGFCYGAGFEKEPAILSKINGLLPVIGNTEMVVSCCKSPEAFFSLCEQLQVPYPKVIYRNELYPKMMLNPPSNIAGWISKEIGASGGGHIKELGDMPIDDKQKNNAADIYYQQFQQGKSVSCLFIASNNQLEEHRVQVIGFNEQLINPSDHAPFRYGGAVSNIMMTDVAKVRFERYINHLSKAIGLVGLNSCDAIWDGDDIYVLEINPRLSATMDLYRHDHLLEKHIAAVDGKTVEFEPVSAKSCAQYIIYAEHVVMIKGDIIWPDWIYDRPVAGSILTTGMPVCTVFAEAETAELATSLVHERAVEMTREFLN